MVFYRITVLFHHHLNNDRGSSVMARLMGERPAKAGEDIIYGFAMEKLPDYVYASFAARYSTPQGEYKSDALFLIPHTGVFAMDVWSENIRIEGGTVMLQDRGGVSYPWNKTILDRKRRAIRAHLKEKFNVTLPVYDLQCFPTMPENPEVRKRFSAYISPDQLVLTEDLRDGDRFLLKMHECCIRQRENLARQDREPYRFSDLTDQMAYNIFYFWETGMQKPNRPAKPPSVFLSHNHNDSNTAAEIQEGIQQRGIFVWRAPDDVEMGEFYKPAETAAIAQCDALLLLLTVSAQLSVEVKFEFEKAMELGKKILPVLLMDESELNPYYKKALEKYQYRIMRKLDPAILDEVVQVVRATGKR